MHYLFALQSARFGGLGGVLFSFKDESMFWGRLLSSCCFVQLLDNLSCHEGLEGNLYLLPHLQPQHLLPWTSSSYLGVDLQWLRGVSYFSPWILVVCADSLCGEGSLWFQIFTLCYYNFIKFLAVFSIFINGEFLVLLPGIIDESISDTLHFQEDLLQSGIYFIWFHHPRILNKFSDCYSSDFVVFVSCSYRYSESDRFLQCLTF